MCKSSNTSTNGSRAMIVDWPSRTYNKPQHCSLNSSIIEGAMPAPSSFRFSKAARRTKKRVHFHVFTKVAFVEKSPREVERCRYTDKDYDSFRHDTKSCAFLLREKLIWNERADDELFRGLERIALASKVLSNRSSAVRSVIFGQ